MVGKRRRSGGGGGVVSPKPLAKVYDGPDRIARHRALLLDLIHGFYKAALVRLPLEEMPELVPRLLKAGLCFGFMDPVSNIIVNTVSYRHPPADEETAAGGARKRRRTERSAKAWRKVALSRIITDISNVSRSGPDPALLPTMSVAVRSLQSMVAFLLCSFRYLFTATALEYLLLAKADLLTAVQLIQQDRNSDTFRVASPVAKVALSCAGLAGCHPKPAVLVTGWQSMYYHLDLVSNAIAMAAEGIIPSTDIRDMYALLKNLPQEPTNQADPLRLATHRIVREKLPRVIGVGIMRSILLDRIHGFYITALARLPRDGLRRRHHRSLLKAGHCYGPMDPVSNIILNTIWYDTAFPAEKEFEVDTILSSSLIRIACRSLYGLVAFLHAHFDALSDLDALWYLLLTNANLEHAVKFLQREGNTLVNDRRKAFKAAAKAGWHPSPDAHAEFAISTVLPTEQSFVLQAGGTLSSGDVELLSQFLSAESSASVGSPKPVLTLSKRASKMLSGMKEELEDEESSICRKVKAALKKYALLKAEPEYELHAICGVNLNVVHTGTFHMHYGWLRKSPVLYQYCHFNFLASQKCSQSAGEVPTLFFAECSNDEDKNDELSCWPVVGSSTDAGRCFYCESHGAKVVHPAFENYHGRDVDFEKMVLGEHFSGWTNDDIINDGIRSSDFVGILEEDCVYFDRLRDAKCAKHFNAQAKDGNGRPRLCC